MPDTVLHRIAMPAISDDPRSVWHRTLDALVIAAVSAFAVLFAIALTHEIGRVAAIWLVNGFILATMLRNPPERGPEIIAAGLIGMAAAFLTVGYEIWLTSVYLLCNVSEIVLVMGALTRLCPDGCRDLTLGKNLPIFTVVALLTPIPGTVLGAIVTDYANTGEWADVAVTWYTADLLGLVTLIPLRLTLQREHLAELAGAPLRRQSFALFTALAAVLMFSFTGNGEPRLFLIFPMLIFIAFRLGFAGATIAVAMTAAVAFCALIMEMGPLDLLHGSARQRVFMVQVFLALATLTSLQVAASLAERRRLLAALKDSEAALVDALDKAESGSRAKTDFLTNMSHELRTPLTAVIGIADNLLRENASYSPDQVRRMHEMQRDAGETLLGLITGILDFERIESGAVRIEHAPFAPDDIAEQCREMMVPLAARKDLALTVEFGESVPGWILGDAFKLRQVLTNLLGNAVKFTPEHGAVSLTITADDTHIRYAVRDTGIGIDPDRIPAIFDRFTQAHPTTGRRFGGSGLGLAISQRLATAMGGTLEAKSLPGVGSTFTLSLPLTPDPLNGAGADEDEVAPDPVRHHRILLVEDTAIIREVMKAMLTSAGHTVDEAEDGAQAVAAAREAPYDLILMDLQMPVLDGLTATRTIRDDPTHPAQGVPIIAVTANAVAGEESLCRQAGMDGFVTKPVGWDNLFATIADVTASRVANLPSTGLPGIADHPYVDIREAD